MGGTEQWQLHAERPPYVDPYGMAFRGQLWVKNRKLTDLRGEVKSVLVRTGARTGALLVDWLVKAGLDAKALVQVQEGVTVVETTVAGLNKLIADYGVSLSFGA